MSENRQGIGQHRVTNNAGGSNTGQRERHDPAAVVGQGSGGEEHAQDHGVPGSVADSMIDMTHGAESSPFYEANVKRKGGK